MTRRLALTVFAGCLALTAAVQSAPLRNAGAATPAPAVPTIAPPTDPRIRVVFFPVTGAPTTDLQDALEERLVTAGKQIINANPLYNACAQNATARKAHSCEPAAADIIISTTLKDASKAAVSLSLSAVDLSAHRLLGSVSKTKDADKKDLTLSTVVKALTLSDEDIRLLIGTPVVRDGRLSTLAGYQPYLQLVPDMSSSDPTYLSVLQNLLSKRGIASVPSQFNAGTITAGNAGIDALCGFGQRYFVYSIGTRSEDRPLSFSTRIQTRTTGHLYDCPTKYDVSFGDTGHTDVTNTKFTLAGLVPLLSTLFISKSNSWSNVTSAGGLVSGFIDVPATTQPVQNHTAEITLQRLVDKFCENIEHIPTPAPLAFVERAQPTPAPTPPAKKRPLQTIQSRTLADIVTAPGTPKTTDAGAAPAAAAPATAAAGNSTPLDIGNFLADRPPQLKCTGDPFRKKAEPSAGGGAGG